MALSFPGRAQQADALWLKAVETARRAEESNVVPLAAKVETTVKKKNGAVEHRSTVVLRSVNRGGSALETEVVSAVEDGKDVTHEARKAEEEGRRRHDAPKGGDSEAPVEVTLDYHPFSPKSQARVSCHRLGEAVLNGQKAVLYSFRQDSASGKASVEGRAWLDEETGTPLQVQASPDPLPRFVNRMTTTVRFEVTADGRWQPKSSILEGEGGFLFYHRLVESDVVFSDFGPRPGAEQNQAPLK